MKNKKSCEYCHTQINRTALYCKFCGQRQTGATSAYVIFIVILMIGLLLLTIFGTRRLGIEDVDNKSSYPVQKN